MTGMRPEINLSWQRSAMAAVDQSADLCDLPIEDVDPRSRLVRAAEPVLEEALDELAETSMCVILSDRDSRLVDVRAAMRPLGAAIENCGGVTGRRFLEAETGTNAIATAYELKRGIEVRGDEHYVERLRSLTCYGQPVINPVTNALEGVVTVVRPAAHESDLMRPFARNIAREIEARLLAAAGLAEQRLLAAYRPAARAQYPVVAIGGTVTLSNAAAIDILGPDDHAFLRGYALEATRRVVRHRAIALPSGRVVDLVCRIVEATSGGVLLELREAVGRGEKSSGTTLAQRGHPDVELERWRRERVTVLVTGEPGSGRSTVVADLAGSDPPSVIHGSDVSSIGERAWLARFGELVTGAGRLVAVEDIHLLPETVLEAVVRRVGDSGAWLAFTACPVAELPAAHRALISRVVNRRELRPLRARTGELSGLVRDMVRGRGVRFTASAIETLAAQPWPGNIAELRNVVDDVLRRRSAGDVTAADLPAAYRTSTRARRLTPLERAEVDAIMSAMRESDGNKSRAASALGISRTTLYQRLRVLGVNA